ncbi:hypothetical protein [Cyanobium sp. Morenito 9A2]|uniref:hypothetical protein n=1 Tax=Cyanobium sp. Morenito 9A2 TaxID=2823718 RepID=UPI0020CD5773|nr:hypothetical protein [Cyanobium sp. Morenito 9A2]MCP9849386.1 hypothetical protein [Cyanobium sp. Morenito 9A2]
MIQNYLFSLLIQNYLLCLLIGLSVASAHGFALASHRFGLRRILVFLLLDAAIIAIALALTRLYLLVTLTTQFHQDLFSQDFLSIAFMGRLPLLLFFATATPYLGDAIAIGLITWEHLRLLNHLIAGLGLPPLPVILFTFPPMALFLSVVVLLQRYRWDRIRSLVLARAEIHPPPVQGV